MNFDYLLAFVGTFAYIGLITVQQRLIVQGNIPLVMGYSCAIEAARMVGLLAVIRSEWAAYPYIAAGSALGAALGIIMHRKFHDTERP